MSEGAGGLVAAIERALGLPRGEGREVERERRAIEAVARLVERCRSGEEVSAQIGERLEEMLAVVTAMTAFDYTKKVALREDDDWIVNALAIGLNMLGDELARATEELTSARDRALAASRAKSAFLANMSHELRTPLNVIIGYSELVREDLEGGQAADAADDLGKIVVTAHHLLKLIKDTLDLSKIEAGRMELSIEEVDLAEAIRDVVATVEPMVAARGNRLTVDAPPGAIVITADLLKVKQILYNLLSNASKFTSHGGIRVIVREEEGADGAPWISAAVADTGVGIPSDKVPLIFGAFAQADEKTAASYGGTGLGLTISRHFAEMMGGELAVESSLGVGSRFTLRLPARGVSGRARVEAIRLPSNAVVLVDRDPRAHDLVRRALARHGLGVLSAYSHFEALNLAAAVRPALVIVDLDAPAVDGWSLLAALRSGDLPVPVVVSSEREERARALALGAADLLRRPMEARRVVEAALRHRQSFELGAVALIAGEAKWHARLRALLEGAGWRVSGREGEPVDAIIVDGRGLAGTIAEAVAALRRPSAPVIVVAGAAARGEIAGPHVVIDILDYPFEDVLALLSQVVHRAGAP